MGEQPPGDSCCATLSMGLCSLIGSILNHLQFLSWGRSGGLRCGLQSLGAQRGWETPGNRQRVSGVACSLRSRDCEAPPGRKPAAMVLEFRALSGLGRGTVLGCGDTEGLGLRAPPSLLEGICRTR